MALALRHRRRAVRAVSRTAPLPLSVAGLALVGPTLDLVGELQHVAVLQVPALVACALAATLQIGCLARRPRAAWLVAAALATGTSVILRLGGYTEGPAFALLGLVALGTGGAFRHSRAAPDLVGDRLPAEQPTSPAVEAPVEPRPIPRAA